MPTVDETIYVALPDFLGLDPEEVEFRHLHEALFQEADGATSIIILGGYLSPGYVRALCARVPRRGNGGRGSFPLRIAIGIEPSRPLAQQWEELDIWPDERSAKAFEISFFEDIASRASQDGRKGRVISSILNGISDFDRTDPRDIQSALERRLAETPWTDSDWIS